MASDGDTVWACAYERARMPQPQDSGRSPWICLLVRVHTRDITVPEVMSMSVSLEPAVTFRENLSPHNGVVPTVDSPAVRARARARIADTQRENLSAGQGPPVQVDSPAVSARARARIGTTSSSGKRFPALPSRARTGARGHGQCRPGWHCHGDCYATLPRQVGSHADPNSEVSSASNSLTTSPGSTPPGGAVGSRQFRTSDQPLNSAACKVLGHPAHTHTTP